MYQIVFSTKLRERSLNEGNQDKLYAYVWGILKEKKCHLYRIGGIEDHIHIVTDIHPTIALADLVKDIKLATTAWIKENKFFPLFSGWQNGYGAFTYSINSKDRLIEYVKNQKKHHQRFDYKSELREFLKEYRIEFDEKYLQ